MPFKSKAIKTEIRLCKYCDNPAKLNIRPDGRNKGYYKTCGNQECLMRQYHDSAVCANKAKLKNPKIMICEICSKEFYQVRANHKRWCKECVPNHAWAGRARRYGIGKPQWDEILEAQGGHCALCDRDATVVDHDHNSLKVRGLLCNSCNRSVVAFDIGKNWLDKAIKYIGG